MAKPQAPENKRDSTRQPPSGRSIPIRITPKLEASIEEAAAETEMPFQEVFRLACRVGLEHMRRINYDLAGAIEDAVEKSPHKPISTAAPLAPNYDKDTALSLEIDQWLARRSKQNEGRDAEKKPQNRRH